MEDIMTVKEIAEYLKLNPATIYKLARSGEIPAAKIASEWRFPKELVDAWLSELVEKDAQSGIASTKRGREGKTANEQRE